MVEWLLKNFSNFPPGAGSVTVDGRNIVCSEDDATMVQGNVDVTLNVQQGYGILVKMDPLANKSTT